MDKKINIFCCCSHSQEDKPLLDQLRKHLNLLKRQEAITIWSDADINPGKVQLEEVTWHFSAAQIVLLLISPDFMNSDHCYTLMQQAVERQEEGAIRVVPILLRPIDLRDSSVAQLQFLPNDGRSVVQWEDKDGAFFNIVQEIRDIVEDLYKPSPPPHERSKSANMGNVSHIPQTPTYSPSSREVELGKESNTIIKNRASIPTWLSILIIIGLVGIGGIGGIYIPQIIHSADNNSRSNTHSPLQSTVSTPSSPSGTTKVPDLSSPQLPVQISCVHCSYPQLTIQLNSIRIDKPAQSMQWDFSLLNSGSSSCNNFFFYSTHLTDITGADYQGGGQVQTPNGSFGMKAGQSLHEVVVFSVLPTTGALYTLHLQIDSNGCDNDPLGYGYENHYQTLNFTFA